ncbi:MAG: TRAP transporter substrate-binding protein [Thermodesulfobacteriota bacterium]
MKQARLTLILCLVFAFTMIVGAFHGTPAIAQTITLTYANFPPAPTFPCVQMERWAKEVNARTNGKVEVKTFPGSTLLGPKNMFDGVVKGVADIGCLATAYQPGRFKLFEAMDLPLGFDRGAVASVVMWDLYAKYKPRSFDDVKVLTMFTCAPANIMSQKPVRSMEDLDGLKLRAAGTGVDIMKRLGAAPEGMPMSAVPEALQKGVVQGLVSSLEVMKDMKFAEYCKFATITDLWVVPFAVVMNKKKWESLPEDVKKVFDDLSKEQALWTGKYVDQHATDAIKWCKDTQGVEFITLSPEQKKEWMAKLEPLKDQYLERTKEAGLPGKEFLQDLLALKEKYDKELKD